MAVIASWLERDFRGAAGVKSAGKRGEGASLCVPSILARVDHSITINCKIVVGTQRQLSTASVKRVRDQLDKLLSGAAYAHLHCGGCEVLELRPRLLDELLLRGGR